MDGRVGAARFQKFAIVFVGVLGLGWSTSAALRRIPAIARFV